jgi:Tfp pilus assembly protein PilN
VKAKPAVININLVPKDPFFSSPLGRILNWALSIGRYIVIFTELVVIISFASRFTLDRQVTDLNDEIHQKQSVVESYGDLEEKVRLTQAKVDQYQQLSQQTNIADIFPQLSQVIPADVQLESLAIKQTSVSIDGSAKSQNALNILINNLKLSQNVFNITVDKIETAQETKGTVKFRVRFDTVDTTQRLTPVKSAPPAAKPT